MTGAGIRFESLLDIRLVEADTRACHGGDGEEEQEP